MLGILLRRKKKIRLLTVLTSISIILIGTGLLFILQEPSKEKEIEDTCKKDLDCSTPMEFLVQSNCPFESACIEETCRVVCPVNFLGEEKICEVDSDCNCSNRGNKNLVCICNEGKCLSIEQ